MKLPKIFKKRIKNARVRSFPSSVKKIIWYEQEQKCKLCGDPLDLRTVNYDHVVRYADGGTNEKENCQALCPNCHAMKSFDDNRKKDA